LVCWCAVGGSARELVCVVRDLRVCAPSISQEERVKTPKSGKLKHRRSGNNF